MAGTLGRPSLTSRFGLGEFASVSVYLLDALLFVTHRNSDTQTGKHIPGWVKHLAG